MEADQQVTWLQIITLIIAVGGLALGIVTATLGVLRHLSDRVVVSVQGTVALPFMGGSVGATQYNIQAYNGGRRPVTLVAAGFDLGASGATLAILDFQEIRLEDGQAVDAYVPIIELARAHVGPKGPVRAAWFRDAGGKKHRTAMRDPAFLVSWAKGER